MRRLDRELEMVDDLKSPTQDVTIALVGKYTQLHDAYISVVEALKVLGFSSMLCASL